MVVAIELRRELVGLALQEAVVAVEPARQRPLVEWASDRRLFHRRQVPLADDEGRIAVRPQHLRDRAGALRHRAGAVRKAGVPVGEPAHADRVMVAPGQQRRPRRRAQRRGVEVRVAQAAGGQPIDVRRLDRGAVTAEMREAEIVEQHHQHIRRPLPRPRIVRPPRFRLRNRAPDGAFVLNGHDASPCCFIPSLCCRPREAWTQ